jgi:hypothetical protein
MAGRCPRSWDRQVIFVSDNPTAPDFDLFISYVRKDVRRRVGRRTIDIVALLKLELERHRRPPEIPGKDRRFRVCTDIDDFALEGTFDEILRDRIGRSRCFLLVATPNVRTSKYVPRELQILEELQPPIAKLAAVLGASVDAVAPGMFDPDVVAADLDQPGEPDIRTWRQALRRESHKIVAEVWRLNPRVVYDRFATERRIFRRRIALAVAGVLLGAVALIITLSGQSGYHRTIELVNSQRVVSAAGVGFSDDDETPVLIGDRRAFLWNDGAREKPRVFALPFPSLHAISLGPGQVALSGLKEVAVVSFPAGSMNWTKTLADEIEALAFDGRLIAASMKNGDLALLDVDAGTIETAPRPISQAGRRLAAFRETGPFRYGQVLALTGGFLASATYTGHLGILNRNNLTFVAAAKPQFPLEEPIERVEDPILYETENSRPISSLAFLRDGTLMFAEGAGLRIVDPRTGNLTLLKHCDIELVRQILPLPDGRTIVALTSSTFEVLRFDTNDPSRLECRQRTTLAPKSAPRGVLGKDGQILIAFFDALPEIWRTGYKIFGILLPPLW